MTKEEPRDRFVHIADIHFWRVVTNPLRLMNKRFFGNLTVLFRRRHAFVMERAEPFADAIAATGVKSVVLTGDFSSTSMDEEFARAVQFVQGLRARGLALYLMPGNHDVYTFESCRAKRFERHFAEFLPRQGYPALIALPGGTPLILVPTVCPRHFSARGRVTNETVESVAALLSNCGPQIVVAGHYPMLHRTRGYASNPFRRLENAEALRRALGESGKQILYLCGHVHRFSYERDIDFPNLEHLSTGAFFRTDRQNATLGEFSEIKVLQGRFEIERRMQKRLP